MPPASDVRSWVELGILVFLTIKALGASFQKHEDIGAANALQLVEHRKKLDDLDGRVQDLRQIRIAERLSRIESAALNHETMCRETFVTRDFCDERTFAATKERNHDHPVTR